MLKNQEIYRLRCEGRSISQIARALNVRESSIPTICKDFVSRYGVPHWDEVKSGRVPMPEIIAQKAPRTPVNILDQIPQLLAALRNTPEMIEELEAGLAELKAELESEKE